MTKALVRAGTGVHVALYRATEGRLGGEMQGCGVILLTTRGRSSGRLRTSPVMRVDHDDAVHVVASAGGGDWHPAWFHNLVADPRVRVRDHDRVRDARAIVLGGNERDAAYAAAVDHMEGFADYERRTDRTIPMVRLGPFDRAMVSA